MGANGSDASGKKPTSAWNVRYWVFGTLALGVLGGVAVVFTFLLYLPSVPDETRPPPSPPQPPASGWFVALGDRAESSEGG